jgi:hypothetical protein
MVEILLGSILIGLPKLLALKGNKRGYVDLFQGRPANLFTYSDIYIYIWFLLWPNQHKNNLKSTRKWFPQYSEHSVYIRIPHVTIFRVDSVNCKMISALAQSQAKCRNFKPWNISARLLSLIHLLFQALGTLINLTAILLGFQVDAHLSWAVWNGEPGPLYRYSFFSLISCSFHITFSPKIYNF